MFISVLDQLFFFSCKMLLLWKHHSRDVQTEKINLTLQLKPQKGKFIRLTIPSTAIEHLFEAFLFNS